MNPNRIFCGLILVLMSFVLACGSKEPEKTQTAMQPAAAEPPPVITSSDGTGSITAEGGWKQATGLHKKAQLQATNSYGDMYLVVFTEKKDRYAGVTLDDYSEVTRGHIVELLSSPSVSRPKQITVSGNPALQYEIHGYAKNSKVAYMHTSVESPMYFHEIIVWTPEDRFQRNHYALENAILSFKEVQPAAAATTPAK
jgi:hypothetical protein